MIKRTFGLCQVMIPWGRLRERIGWWIKYHSLEVDSIHFFTAIPRIHTLYVMADTGTLFLRRRNRDGGGPILPPNNTALHIRKTVVRKMKYLPGADAGGGGVV